ncbi:MAG: 16S rRNA (adenine(1518)-N(6)/adenine(1519)-N(6))-dimethyltransferase RsmA [Victivallales bacterium]|nr:16S rRNA (adenine(1518)-N(6)/adenine(1519)-N(6))-dimethyltransferase RsmA [Victivallales bacterium]MCF7888486.1 16S rRNA (adenine(1518)-N(6)/adenine(1519)-N(6))-dimethyltransferase RsmA [Victivallales bacterium]
MKKNKIISVLSEFGITPSKRLGQNFLIDENLLDFIVRTADIKAGDHVLEVGPGLGVLTKKIIENAEETIAVEFDSRLAEYIKKNIKSENFTLIEKDALSVDYNKLCTPDKKWRVLANLPYSITTPLLAEFAEMEIPPENMLFLLQKESAGRFTANPSTKEYGAITVKLQSIYNIEIVRTVSPDVFFPKPDITSAIVKFIKKDELPSKNEILNIDRIVHSAFSHRRKKVINNLSSFFPEADFEKMFKKYNLDFNSRAEQLTTETFRKLSKEVYCSRQDTPSTI